VTRSRPRKKKARGAIPIVHLTYLKEGRNRPEVEITKKKNP
jgi:hypothetical protein